MRKSSRLALAMLVTAFMLSWTVGSASANRLSSDDQDFRIVWSPVTVRMDTFADVECNFTLLGTLHRSTFAKVFLALIGSVIATVFSSCRGGIATVLAESLPWHFRYDGFGGTLPNITGIDTLLVGMGFSVTSEGVTCLARTDEVERFNGLFNLSRGTATSYMADPDATIDANDVGVGTMCDLLGLDLSFSGTATVEDHTGEQLRFSLI